MRAIIAAAVIGAAVSVSPALAEEGEGDICAALASLAHTYAKAKYAGVPMGEIMAFVMRDPESSMTPIYRAMAIDAYGLPDYRSRDNQLQAMHEYSNEVALTCYRDWK